MDKITEFFELGNAVLYFAAALGYKNPDGNHKKFLKIVRQNGEKLPTVLKGKT
jgi:hypothetical protein